MTTVPVLANLFEVGLDSLFDYDSDRRAAKIEERVRHAAQIFWGNPEKCEAELLRLLEEYPGSERIPAKLLNLYESHMHTHRRMEYADRAARIAQRLIAEGKDIFKCVRRKVRFGLPVSDAGSL